MLKKLMAISLLFSLSSHAYELTIGSTLSNNGYVDPTTTIQAKKYFYYDRTKIDFSISAKDDIIRPMASLTYSDNLTFLKVGSYNEFYGFLAEDDISFTGLAMLPQGVYSQNFVRGAFSVANGVTGGIWGRLGNHRWEASLSLGKPYVLNYEAFERSMFSGIDQWVNVSADRSRSFSATYQYRNTLTLLYAINKVDVTVHKEWDWTIKDVLLSGKIGSSYLYLAPEYLIQIERTGFKLAISPSTEIVVEQALLSIENERYNIPGSTNRYVILYHSLSPVYELTMGKSVGGPANRKHNYDTHIGINMCKGNFSAALELHVVEGTRWFYTKPAKDKNNIVVFTWRYKL
jgi:hypothetical protein